MTAKMSIGQRLTFWYAAVLSLGLALFGAGMLLGVGLGLMVAPKPGRDLREDLRQRLGRGEQPGSNANGQSAPEAARPA